MRPLTRLPRLCIDTEILLRKAEGMKDLVTYDSDIKSAGYITDGTDIVIATRRGGYLRLSERDIDSMILELAYIREDMERRKRN